MLTCASIAGGGAYYFAKKEINADRQAKLEAHRRKTVAQQSLEYGEPIPNQSSISSLGNANGGSGQPDIVGLPSQEASSDPAPRHPSTVDTERNRERNKYESSVPYRAPKGDRFS